MKIRNDIKMEIIFLTKSNIKQYLISCYLLTLRKEKRVINGLQAWIPFK